MTANIVGRLARIAVGAILVAAFATVASLFSTTATANAADQYVVVAVGLATTSSFPSEAWRSEPTSNKPESTQRPTAKIAVAITASCRPVRRTRARQQRPMTMASLQARLTPFYLCCRKHREEQVAGSAGCARRRVGLHGSAAAAAATTKPASGPQAGTDGLLGSDPRAVSWPTSRTVAGWLLQCTYATDRRQPQLRAAGQLHLRPQGHSGGPR